MMGRGRRAVVHCVSDDARTESVVNGYPGVRTLCGAVNLRLADLTPTVSPSDITCKRCRRVMVRIEHGRQPRLCSSCGWGHPYVPHVCTADGGRAAEDGEDGWRLNRPASTVGDALRLAMSHAGLTCCHKDRPVESTRDVHYAGYHVVLALCGPCEFDAGSCQPVRLASGDWVRLS